MFDDAKTTARKRPSASSHVSISFWTSSGESGLAGGRLSQTIPISPRSSSLTMSSPSTCG